MSGKGTESEEKVSFTRDICGFSLQTLRPQTGKGKGISYVQGEGTKEKENVRLSLDICGFNLQTLKQQ